MRARLSLAVIPILLIACGSLAGSSSTTTGTDDADQPVLSEGDFPETSPCSGRDILPNDLTFLDTVTDATQMLHIHKAYTNDAELPALCGLAASDNSLMEVETGWDPSAGTDAIACKGFSEDFSTFPSSTGYYPGMCRAGFGLETENAAAAGFPRGGTYRLDTCIENDEKRYSVRIRVSVSGNDVNKTWTKVGVTNEADLEIFDDNGNQLSTTVDLKSLLAQQQGVVVFTVRSDDGKKTHLTVGIQVICIKATETCPTPTEECSS